MEPNENNGAMPEQPIEQPIEQPTEQPTEQLPTEPAPEPAPDAEPDQTAPESAPTPAENAPAKKPNKPLIITLICILVASVIGIAVILAMLPPDGNGGDSDQDSGNDQSSSSDAIYDLGEFSNFDLAFLQLENNGTNNVYSPLSIKYALAMLQDAADGESYTQIHELIGDFTPKIYTNNEHRSFANAMFIRDAKKDQILDSYISGVESKYGASVVFDPFSSPDPLNLWISDKTLGIINNMFDETIIEESDFILANALGIDMDWKYELQCQPSNDVDCLPKIMYNVKFAHENYSHYIGFVDDYYGFDKMSFNGQEVESAKIGSTANRYDIISELGEEYIRSTVLAAYDDWLEENKDKKELYPEYYPDNYDIDKYMEELASNYGMHESSTDFYFNVTENEKVFAKDLKEYDGSTLQYIGIMPKEEELSAYIESLTAEKAGNLISGLKDVAEIDSFKDGVVTKIEAHIPFFKFDKELDFVNDLKKLGIEDVFDKDNADLTKLTNMPKSYIKDAIHKADIDFSNEGIKAAAATAFAGGLGSTTGGFEYKWDIPVEEIDLTFDKPFLFLIRDKATGEIWFAGSYYSA